MNKNDGPVEGASGRTICTIGQLSAIARSVFLDRRQARQIDALERITDALHRSWLRRTTECDGCGDSDDNDCDEYEKCCGELTHL